MTPIRLDLEMAIHSEQAATRARQNKVMRPMDMISELPRQTNRALGTVGLRSRCIATGLTVDEALLPK